MTTKIAPRGRVRRSGAHRRGPVAALVPATPGQPRFLPAIALIVVAVIWGVTFSVVDLTVIDTAAADPGAVRTASSTMPPADLVAWRFGLGAVAVLAIRVAVISPVAGDADTADVRGAPIGESRREADDVTSASDQIALAFGS